WNERRQFLRDQINIRRSGDALEREINELRRYVRDEMDAIEQDRSRFDAPPEKTFEQKERLYYELLSLLNESIERRLIDITADMESMGPRGSGHVLQDIQYASYFINEFNRMVGTLEVGNMHGWINYRQFADRGMRPTFNIIQNAGERLKGAQE